MGRYGGIGAALLGMAGVAALAGAAGCAGMADLTTARALGAGTFEFGVALSFFPSVLDSDLVGLPALDLAFRLGVSDDVDVGVRVNTMMMVNLDAKIVLSDEAGHGVALLPGVGVSVAPLVSERLVSRGAMLQFDLPVLLDVRFGRADTLVLSPRYTLLLSTYEGVLGHYLGGGVAGAFDVDPAITVQPFAVGLFGLVGSNSLLSNIIEVGVGSRFR